MYDDRGARGEREGGRGGGVRPRSKVEPGGSQGVVRSHFIYRK